MKVGEAPTPERKTLRIREAVAVSGICRSKLYSLMGEGALQSVKVGRSRLVVSSSLDRLLTPPAEAA